MMTVNIPLLIFLQRAFVITLPENQKTNCGEKKVSCNLLDSHLLQLTIRYLKCQRANMILKYHHKMSNSEKKVYYFLKKVYSFFHVFRIPYIAVKLMLVFDVGYHYGLKFHISFRYFQTKN